MLLSLPLSENVGVGRYTGLERLEAGVRVEDVECLRSAETRSGLVTRAEVPRHCTTRQLHWRLTTGAWVPVFPNVYRVAGAPETWRQKLEALAIWAGNGAVLSHRSAAALHGFSRFDEGALEVTLTSQQRAPEGATVHRTRALLKSDVTEIDDLPVTSAVRTLIDLSPAMDKYTMRASLDQALRKKWMTLDALRRAATLRKGRPGAPELLALIHEFDGGDGPTESELEALMLQVIDSSGLARPTVQKRGYSGEKRVRVDLFFEKGGVIIEGDGYEHHSGVDEFESERERNNLLTAGGFLVLHWTWRALHDQPEELVNQLLAALNSRRS